MTADMEANLENLDEMTDPQLRKALEVVISSLRGEGIEPSGSSQSATQEQESSQTEEFSQSSWESSDAQEDDEEESSSESSAA